MKKLLLTSYATFSLPLLKDLLPLPAQSVKAVFIPTAGNPYENKDFVYSDRDKLLELGFDVKEVDLATTQGAALEKALEGVQLILVAGGDTFYLLDQVRKSGFDVLIKKLLDQGVIYVGSSAGSIICCPTIEGAKRFDNPESAPDLTNYQGLNLVPFIVIPHTHKEKYKERVTITTAELTAQKYQVIHLTDDQAVEVSGNEYRVVDITK